MGTKINQSSYAYLTQACARAKEYLAEIDLVYNPGQRDRVVASINSKMAKAKRAQKLEVAQNSTSCNNAMDKIACEMDRALAVGSCERPEEIHDLIDGWCRQLRQ